MGDQPHGLNEPETVDMVALSPDDSHIELIMIQTGNWDGSTGLLLRLQEKWQNYMGYALYGSLRRAYPDYADLPWRIVLECRSEPDAKTKEFLIRAHEVTKKEGGELVVRIPQRGAGRR